MYVTQLKKSSAPFSPLWQHFLSGRSNTLAETRDRVVVWWQHLPQLPLLLFEAHFRFRKGFPICFLGKKLRTLSKGRARKLRKIRWEMANHSPDYDFATTDQILLWQLLWYWSYRSALRPEMQPCNSEWTNPFEQCQANSTQIMTQLTMFDSPNDSRVPKLTQ